MRMRQTGFTLVEVLAAVMLLSIGLLAVTAASKTARQYQERTVYIAVGRNIAQGRIDKLRSISIDSLPAQAGTTTSASLPAGNAIQTTVVGYPAAGETDMRRVVVRVSWPEAGGTRSINYETLIVRR
jgi:prepilin-type N-terminal cleavage/methylation domain-containing protein